MVEHSQWKMVDEGNLARTWERRLKPREVSRPRRRWAPWARTVMWLGLLWVACVVATWLAIEVVLTGYRVDALNRQYTSLVRQNQTLKVKVAEMTSAAALQRDAAKYKVRLVVPKSAPVRPPYRPVTTPALGWSTVSQWIVGLRGAISAR